MPRLWDDSPEPRRKGRFEIYVDGDEQWRFRLKSPNGKIIAASEGYTSKQNCIKGVLAVVNTAPNAWILNEDGTTI
jgi:uncharacterized protein YegP (UPF0339 family)